MNPTTDADPVRDHYDRVSVLYRAFWGEHIHHGYWCAGQDGPVGEAQVRLVEHLAEWAGVPRGGRVLDVGCGVGGSARWLAAELGCAVDGITLSPVQAGMATEASQREAFHERTRFWVHDARRLDELDEADYDAVWTVECSEHLAERSAFLAAAARRLRPGGVLALASWVRAEGPLDGRQEQLLADLCDGMICPPLSTLAELAAWAREAGLEAVGSEDWTPHVARTWDRVARIARRPAVRALVAASDERTRRFAEAFPTMQRAYAEGALRYGVVAARVQ